MSPVRRSRWASLRPRRIPPIVALLLLPVTACSSGSTTTAGTPPNVMATTPAPSPTPAATRAVPVPTLVPSSAAPSPSASPSAVPTAPPRETPPPPGAPTCKPGNLTLTDADTLVTQRYREQVFVLRTSGPDCGLSGYPTVNLKGDAGKAPAVTYSRGGFGLSTAPAAPLTLSRTTSASFSLATSRTSPCTEAATISVLLPGTSAPLVARTTARVCQGRAGLSSVRRLHADG